MKILTIATRESPLALWQANEVKARLQTFYPDLSIQLLGLTTTADKMLETPLTEVGGKGLFVKELEEALLTHRADIAVHSMKDVPMELPKELCLPVMCEREDPRDAFLSVDYANFFALPKNARVGTSSLRRQSQLYALRNDLKIEHLRGNVNTRITKLDRKEYDAIILAVAGLKRLDLANRITTYFTLEESLPAPGQGVIGIECRQEDHSTQQLISVLNHEESQLCVIAERAVSKALGGSCQIPLGAFAKMNKNQIFLRALVGRMDGSLIIRSELSDKKENAENIGLTAAKDLLNQGAGEILNCLQKN